MQGFQSQSSLNIYLDQTWLTFTFNKVILKIAFFTYTGDRITLLQKLTTRI